MNCTTSVAGDALTLWRQVINSSDIYWVPKMFLFFFISIKTGFINLTIVVFRNVWKYKYISF